METTEQQLHRLVLSTVKELEDEELEVHEWLNSGLGIQQYAVDYSGDLLGAEIMICCGGPTVWVDTQHNTVEGRWGDDKRSMMYDENEELDQLIESEYETVKGTK